MIQSPSHRASKKFFYVYVDNLGVLGTSRVNVDEDLMMAVQTKKSRGLDTYEEIVHSNTATALGIHIDLRNMLVSVCGPNAFVAIETGSSLGAALSGCARNIMGGALGTHDLCGPAQTRCAQCALCSQKVQFTRETVAKCQGRSASLRRSSAGNRQQLDT